MDVNYPISTGSINKAIRKEVVDSMVKQIAERSYKFKQACAIVPTSAWTNTFFREKTDVLAGQSGNATMGVPRGAAFPHAYVEWQEVSVRIVKHALEATIPWEDVISGDINVQARQIIKCTEGVVYSVDTDIWNSLTENQTPVLIQTFNIVNKQWDAASAAIIDDLMKASQLIASSAYTTDNLICFVSPRDKRSILKWIVDKGSQFPNIAADVAVNGSFTKLGGITLVEANNVTASMALVCKPKTCATYKELVSLRSDVTEDPFRSVRIRVVEEGKVELTDPKSCVLIKNTQFVTG